MPRSTFSAGALLYRQRVGQTEVLLIHPGGPFWRSRNKGWWQIPKGALEPGETPEIAARREAAEELGVVLTGPVRPLGTIRQAGGKRVEAFAVEQDFDTQEMASITFRVEWPPRSGQFRDFPEADAARWFSLAEAAEWMLPSQQPLLARLTDLLAGRLPT